MAAGKKKLPPATRKRVDRGTRTMHRLIDKIAAAAGQGDEDLALSLLRRLFDLAGEIEKLLASD